MGCAGAGLTGGTADGMGTPVTELENCYWSGTRTWQSFDAYSLVYTNFKSLKNSYFDITKFPTGKHNGTGLTTDQMKEQSNYVGWDFNNTWKMGEDGLPELKFD